VAMNIKYINEKLEADLMGPLKTSHNGNEYLIAIVDFFSKRSVAFPKKAKTVEILLKLWNML
jgi:hypothetical protein